MLESYSVREVRIWEVAPMSHPIDSSRITRKRLFRAQFTDRRPSIQTVQTEPFVETKVCITPLFETSKTERFACQASVWRLLSATKCHYRFSMIDSCNFPSRSLRGKPERPHRRGRSY